MKPLTAAEVERILREHGFRLDRSRGSHRVWVKDGWPMSIVVPHHGNAPLKQGLLIGIFKDAGIPKPRR